MSDEFAVTREQITYYDARAAEYDEWFERRGRYDRGPEANAEWFADIAHVRATLSRVALDGGDVLELAPGTGLWTRDLVTRARSLTVVDASEPMLALTRQRLGAASAQVNFERGDLFAWEPPHEFDAVVFCFWISHVPRERLDGFAGLLARCLRPGGEVFFVDSQRDHLSTAHDHVLPEDEEQTMVRRLDDGREFRIIKNFWSPAELESALAAHGLECTVTPTSRFFYVGVGQRHA